MKKITCEFCGKDVAKNKKGLSIHRRHNKECNEKWLESEKIKEDKKTKITCKIFGKSLRYISNTHLENHNINQQEYKEKYPNSPIFSDGLLDIQKNNREATISEKYTIDEIKYLQEIGRAHV